MNTDNLIENIEKHLGTINMGWECDEGILIARFDGQPCARANTYVTLGLHRHLLHDHCKEYRQELLFAAWDRFPDMDIVCFLKKFLRNVIMRNHEPLLRGEVIGPSSVIIPGSTLTAIYASIPVIFHDDFAVYHGTTPPTVFIWLLPIHAEEAKYIEINGWNAFEDCLVEKDPDLMDLTRDTLISL